MKVYHFNKEKYSNGILMDLGDTKNTLGYNFTNEVHYTTFFEIIIIKKGKGTIYLDTNKIDFQEGHFLFISPYQKRKWITDHQETEAYFIIFEQDFLNDFFSDKFFVYRLQYFFNNQVATYFKPNKKLFSFEGNIFHEVEDELKNPQQDSIHLLRSILYYILIKLNREFCIFHHINSDTHGNEIAIEFKNLLQENIGKIQHVNDYCKLLKISRITLNHSIKKQFGTTVTEMIHNQLLYEIKDKILFSHQNISEIAYSLNFKEPQHLNRFFKRLTQQTPLEFKYSYRNGYTKL